MKIEAAILLPSEDGIALMHAVDIRLESFRVTRDYVKYDLHSVTMFNSFESREFRLFFHVVNIRVTRFCSL